ncbi:hypothetical protein TrST_g14221 [Triparma strigata]|uniref:Uncharacterized protein n=1 Tax=Triparma strigata TaxID=1606541 RepID=A0A9W7B2V9_9STRA|nr:hypothetical protein TrST_g14221 [Triparma strigata]
MALSSACADIQDCGSCTNSTWSCHWCDFDDACHAIGSIYGCAFGVECYNIDRCMRTSPEPAGDLPPPATVLALVITFAILGCCCLTCCLLVGWNVKKAYLDLLPYKPPPNPNEVKKEDLSSRLFEMTTSATTWASSLTSSEKKRRKSRGPSLDLGEDLDYDLALVENDQNQEVAAARRPDSSPTTSPQNQTPSPPPPSHPVHCLWRCCWSVYALCLVAIVVISTLTVSLWPHYPQYNMCSDELDWGSIVSGMESLKPKASFQLLASIYNPNYLNLYVNQGSGVLRHGNDDVGILDFGSDVEIRGNSITDVLITATFIPSEWEALSLTSEYYSGTLEFMVDATITVGIPALGYTGSSQWNNYLIKIGGAYEDRSLCACEQW